MFIYAITNKINGKQYIGQTIQAMEKRWNQHKIRSNQQNRNQPLYNALRKYDIDNFEIKQLATANSIEELNELEIYYIKEYNTLAPNGYNLKDGGAKGRLSQESKDKISKANKGKKATPEAKANMSKAQKGRKQTPEEITKRVEKLRGQKRTQKQKLNISKALKGRKGHIAWNKGIPPSLETIEKLRLARKNQVSPMKNKKHTEESKEKMRMIKKSKKHTLEAKLNMSKAQKLRRKKEKNAIT